MNKILVLIPLGLLLVYGQYRTTKVEVIKKATAIKVEPGYALKDDDSTFKFQEAKYLIVTNETFDEKGNIVSASMAGDVGYSTYTEQDFSKYKNLIADYSLTKAIDVKLINNQSILINGRKIITLGIDRKNKEIYYKHKSKDTLFRITYR
jgi:hypothetical protein